MAPLAGPWSAMVQAAQSQSMLPARPAQRGVINPEIGRYRVGRGRARHVPEALQVLAGQDQEGLALGEPGRRAAHGVVQDPVQALGRDGLAGEPAHHVTALDDLGEVHAG